MLERSNMKALWVLGEIGSPLASGLCLGDIERGIFKILNLQVRSYILLTKIEKEKKNF